MTGREKGPVSRDNYEISRENARKYFLTFDPKEIEKRPFLSHDGEWFYTALAGQICRVSRADGTVYLRREDGGWENARFNAALTVYDLLCWSKPDAVPSGEFVTIGSLNNVFTSSDNSGFYASYASWFNDRPDALRRACSAMGGVPAKVAGDMAYLLPLTDFLSMVLQFWEADEEFPASLTLLFDSRVLDFMHFETVWYAAAHLMERLKTLAEEA